MARLIHHRRLRRVQLALVIAALAGLASAALVGLAVAKTLTLQVAKGASVTNQSGSTTTEGIVVNAKGRAVYTLSGDTTTHPKCTKASGCFSFWPPVTVSSAKGLSKAAGVKGKLGTFKRNGIIQVTLSGHPLYTFANDRKRAARPARASTDSAASGTSSRIRAGARAPVRLRQRARRPRRPPPAPRRIRGTNQIDCRAPDSPPLRRAPKGEP